MAIGLFYLRLRSASKKVFFVSISCFAYFLLLFILTMLTVKQTAKLFPKLLNKYCFTAFYQNITFTLFLLQLLLLSNDIAENPGPENKVSEINIFHWNARSVRHKLNYLQTISDDSSVISVICITESHLDNNILMEDITIPGYHTYPFRNDRNCFGGGVLVYIADNLHATRRRDLEFVNGELIWFELKFTQIKY